MTDHQYRTLGKFTPEDSKLLERAIEIAGERDQEIIAAYERIKELEFLLQECREYFEERADAEYSTESAAPHGNIEMTMLVSIDELLK